MLSVTYCSCGFKTCPRWIFAGRFVSFGTSGPHDLFETKQSSSSAFLRIICVCRPKVAETANTLILEYRPITACLAVAFQKIRFGPIVSVGRLRVFERVTARHYIRACYGQKPNGVKGPRHVYLQPKYVKC